MRTCFLLENLRKKRNKNSLSCVNIDTEGGNLLPDVVVWVLSLQVLVCQLKSKYCIYEGEYAKYYHKDKVYQLTVMI